MERVIAHELAHILYNNLSKDEKNEYHRSAKWFSDPLKGRFRTKRTIFSEDDGSSDPDEDFANNIEHLLFESNPSRKIDSEIINCLKQILGS